MMMMIVYLLCRLCKQQLGSRPPKAAIAFLSASQHRKFSNKTLPGIMRYVQNKGIRQNDLSQVAVAPQLQLLLTEFIGVVFWWFEHSYLTRLSLILGSWGRLSSL